MRILTKSQDEVPRAEFVYCFVDCERDEDPFAASVLQRKQFHRIRTYVKLVLALPTMYQKQALAALNGPFAPLLAVLTSKDRSGLLGEIEKSDGASTLLQARAKGVAAARFLKGCWQGTAQLPPKVAPLLQAIVTCIRVYVTQCESSEWLLRKVSIAAARAVCLLHGKPAALKLSQNLLGEKPVAFLQALEIVAGSEIFTKVEILRDVVKSTEMSDKNLTLLRLLATHLSGASVKLISHKFEELLNSLSSTAHEELAAKCVLPFLTKLGSSAVLTFVRYFANNLLADEISAVGICYLRLLRMLTPMLLRHFQEQEVVQTCFGSVINLLPLHVGNSEMPSDLIGLYKEGLQFVDSLRKGLDSQQYQPVFLENLKLREYQREGVSWLLFLARYNLSGILADDMGLGKTVQTLCALVEGHMVSPLQHSLIICPGSVLHHWETELKHYISRSGLRPQIVTPKTNSFTGQILITSYNAVGKLENIPQLLYLVLDEGHLLRNPKTVLYSKIASIKAQKKLILTGTPIQNGVMDIWALFHLLMPGLLGTQEEFSRQYRSDLSASRSANTRAHGNFEFKNEKSALCRLEQLHKQVLPFILRRLKSDVLKDLPDKVIQDYTCQLTELQTQLLTEYQATTHSQLEEINYLRKLSAHPCRVASVPCLLEHSSKLTALSELIRDCEIAEEAGGNHKALIFSQSTKVLDLVERLVLEPLFPKTSFARIDGRISPQERGQVATAFNCLTGPNLLLLTTSVGGLGLNLTAADIVIFLDHSWNPAEDAQAMDRAHRLGQKNVVNVYRLVTEGTIEETVLGLQNFKRRLAQELITEENSSTSQFNIASMAEDLARGSAK